MHFVVSQLPDSDDEEGAIKLFKDFRIRYKVFAQETMNVSIKKLNCSCSVKIMPAI